MTKSILRRSVSLIAFMSDVCETVQIKGAGGEPVRVNKSDYDADQDSDKPTMKLFTKDNEGEQTVPPIPAASGFPEGATPTAAPIAPNFGAIDGNAPNQQGAQPLTMDPEKQAAAPTAPSPEQLVVVKEGTTRKPVYFVVNGTGEKVERTGLEKDGYATEADAWAAIVALPR